MATRGKLVGEAYILMRADGSLLKTDMERFGRLAADAMDVEEDGPSFSEKWEAELKKVEQNILPRMSRMFAKATAESDWTPWIKQFNNVQKASYALTNTLKEWTDQGLITESQQERMTASFNVQAAAIFKMNREMEIAADAAKRYKDSFAGVYDQSLIERAKKWRKQFAEASIDMSFNKMARAGDDATTTLIKLTRQLDDYQDVLKLSEEEYEEATAALGDWVRRENELSEALQRSTAALEEQKLEMERYKKSYTGMFDRREADKVQLFFRQFSDAQIDKSFARMAVSGETAEKTVARLTARLEGLRSRGELTRIEVDRMTDSLNEWVTTAKRATDNSVKFDLTKYEKASLALRTLSNDTDGFGKSIGKVFGEGSRNNFVNIMGKLLSLPFKAVVGGFSLVTSGVSKFVSAFGDLQKAGAESSGSALGLMASLKNVLPALGKSLGGPGGIAALIGAMVAGLAALTYVLPGVVSLISLLAGALVALAGGVVVGLTAGLLALAPAAVAAGAGFTVFALSVAAWAQSKEGKGALKEFNNELKKTAKEIMPELGKISKNVLGGLTDLLKNIGPGMNAVLRDFNKELSSPATQSALQSWGKSLAVMTGDIGSALSNLTIGMINFFEPILPYAERFTGWLDRITGSFKDWASSVSGKNSVADWMSSAWEVGKDLWGIVEKLSTALWKIFNLGSEGSGAGMLDTLNSKMEQLNQWLDKPENQGKLKSWFADAGAIAESLGNIAVEVGKMVVALNSPEGREGAKAFMEIIKQVAEAMNWVIDKIPAFNLAFNLSLAQAQLLTGNIGGAAKTAKDAWDQYQRGVEASVTTQDRAAASIERTRAALAGTRDALLSQGDWGTFKILVDDKQWVTLKAAIEGYVFDGKQITIKGNEALWNATKGTIASYVFNSKEVAIRATGYEVTRSQLDYIKKMNLGTKTVGIRYVVSGRLPGGGVSNAGGSTQQGSLIPGSGIAIPDFSVAGASGGNVVFAEGAIQIATRAQSPAVIQSYLMASLTEAMERV